MTGQDNNSGKWANDAAAITARKVQPKAGRSALCLGKAADASGADSDPNGR